jgi:hypothetical protein
MPDVIPQKITRKPKTIIPPIVPLCVIIVVHEEKIMDSSNNTHNILIPIRHSPIGANIPGIIPIAKPRINKAKETAQSSNNILKPPYKRATNSLQLLQ